MPNGVSRYAERNKKTGLVRRTRTRSRLIEAGIRVFLDFGFEAPVIEDFVAAADVSRGSFYNHFQTKEELLEAVSTVLRKELMVTYEEAKLRISDPAERLVGGIRFLIRNSRENPRWGLLLLQMPASVSSAEAEFRRGPRRDLKDCISRGILPKQNLEIGVDLIIGTTGQGIRAAASLARPQDYPEQIATLLLMALGMEPSMAAEIARRPFQDLSAVTSELPAN
ncbi:TetR/AcrR family transcriptional regulator [Sphingomonas sp. LaA6.9]|uniref:TetR/AcrR family transcriptional regulator n=1 Tax=Sphingomonas sp. LaA6.9 TaxID=2919914 RepID=UPI001F5012A8|nr:TetR/AcrR family transcriptional regulator [Sphingomonas sp. LaA6.9]MCJ8157398.1 TetR/AcrR family transcriptional regulator [Sphingomonas sp. LaA6.9]